MKLNATQLQRQLAEGLAPVYVVSGDEPLLCGESEDQIRRACRAAGSEERLVFHVDRSFDWSQVREAGNSLSLFAQKRLIELRIPGGKPGDEGAKVLTGGGRRVRRRQRRIRPARILRRPVLRQADMSHLRRDPVDYIFNESHELFSFR